MKEARAAAASYKIIVFFPTARQTAFYAGLFNQAGLEVLEIHSRKNQGARTKTSDLFRCLSSPYSIKRDSFLSSAVMIFRTKKNVILFSSDVSARGMDYPDVTFVLQVGLTTRDQYIHRYSTSELFDKVNSADAGDA